jgi:hypothetical protein
MAEEGFRLWFYGHTHEARVWRLVEAGPLEVDSCRVDLQPEQCYVVNVGTAGRPLPRRGGPSFTIYDDNARFLEVIPLASR